MAADDDGDDGNVLCRQRSERRGDGSNDDGGDGRDGDSDDGSDDGVELGRQHCQHCGDDCHGNTASTAIRTAIMTNERVRRRYLSIKTSIRHVREISL